MKREKSAEQQAWERDVLKEHPTAAFYIEVRGGTEHVIAYDVKDAGKVYGEFCTLRRREAIVNAGGRYLLVTITYTQGVVKRVLVEEATTFVKFAERVAKSGRLRRIDMRSDLVPSADVPRLQAEGCEVIS